MIAIFCQFIVPPYVPPPPLVGTIKERCQQALEHVVSGLQCLPFFDLAPSFDETVSVAIQS